MNLSFIDMSYQNPKLSAEQLVNKMKSKGIKFNIQSESEVIDYLDSHNNYFRTASYRKNYDKYLNGEEKGKYIDLDFAYLTELSTIDMHLRFLVIKMCLDIEHSLKVAVLTDIAANNNENGYEIVKNFLLQNEWILKDIYNKRNSTYVCDLVDKYFTFDVTVNDDRSVVFNHIEIRCPIWAFMELITFGQFLHFYDNYSFQNNTNKYMGALNSVKSLRNACAHNNCVIHNLRKGYSRPSYYISNFIKGINTISKSERKTKLTIRPLYEMVSLLYLYDNIVSGKVKENRYKELNRLVNERMLKHADYFKNQQIITASFNFLKKIVDFLI